MALNTRIVRQTLLSGDEREQMYALQSRFYDDVVPEKFTADLAEKDWVIVLRGGDQKILGFSTQKILCLPIEGRETLFLFSGDTIVSPECWLESHLAGAFAQLMARLWNECREPPYWFLITKGFRTYRFLPVFFKRFVPCVDDRDTDGRLLSMRNAVAAHKFGNAYDAESGLIITKGMKDRLCPGLRTIPGPRLRDPHVRFFLEHNPDYASGVELACLAPMSRSNLKPTGHRVLERTLVEWVE